MSLQCFGKSGNVRTYVGKYLNSGMDGWIDKQQSKFFLLYNLREILHFLFWFKFQKDMYLNYHVF